MSGDGDRFPISSSSGCPFSLPYHHRLPRKLLNGEINWPTMWLFLYIWFPSLLSCPPPMPPTPWTGVDPFTSVMAPNVTNTLTGVDPLHSIMAPQCHQHTGLACNLPPWPSRYHHSWLCPWGVNESSQKLQTEFVKYKENKKKHKDRIAKENKLSIW